MAVGNSYAPEVVSGRCDAFVGQVMLGDGRGNFMPMNITESGFFVDGDAKSIVQIVSGGRRLILVGQNSDSLKVFDTKRKTDPFITLKSSEVVALVRLTDGQSRRMEIGYGTGYISQSSRTLFLMPFISHVDIYDTKGHKTRSASVRNGRVHWVKPA
jgi:hypothetical protein